MKAESASGTFSGVLDASSITGPVTIYFYGPARLPRWKAWLYRLTRREWPLAVVASGPAVVTEEEDGVFTWKADGTWHAHD